VVLSKNAEDLQKHVNSFHFILDTVAAKHDINPFLTLLRRDATLTQVGVPAEPLEVQVFNLITNRRSFSARSLAASPNAGDAGLLRPAQPHLRHRAHPGSKNQ